MTRPCPHCGQPSRVQAHKLGLTPKRPFTKLATCGSHVAMKDFRNLVDAVGPATLSEWIGVSRKHIGVMKIRNSIPPVYWPRIVAKMPKSAKVSLDDLARMYETQREVLRASQRGNAA